MSTKVRPGERGFTLVEALAAFAIAAVSLAVVYQAVSTGVAGGVRGRELAGQALEAPSILAGLGTVLPLQVTDDSPVPDREGWSYSVAIVPDLFSTRDSDVRLYRIELRYGGDTARTVTTYRTLRGKTDRQ